MRGLLYGTAWKEERTKDCVLRALKAGFRAIDTANQRKHYFETAVGEAIKDSGLLRSELFLQTKFTFAAGQDHRLPYDAQTNTATQVNQSLESSLEHLGTDYLDSYLLHGPSQRPGLGERDLQAYEAMQRAVQSGVVRSIGVSNVSADQLREFISFSTIKPSFVQNRCYARTGWDAQVRQLCQEHQITYQGFSLLTANRAELSTPVVHQLAKQHDATIAQLIFAYTRQLPIWPLTGTTSSDHMAEDLLSLKLTLPKSTCVQLDSLIVI